MKLEKKQVDFRCRFFRVSNRLRARQVTSKSVPPPLGPKLGYTVPSGGQGRLTKGMMGGLPQIPDKKAIVCLGGNMALGGRGTSWYPIDFAACDVENSTNHQSE